MILTPFKATTCLVSEGLRLHRMMRWRTLHGYGLSLVADIDSRLADQCDVGDG